MTTKTRSEAKKKLNEHRLAQSKIKEEFDDKLGDVTLPTPPQDIQIMYVGKMADMLVGQKVRAINTLKAYKRTYEFVDAGVEEQLNEQHKLLEEDFTRSKRRMMRKIEEHPLWDRLGGIKGFSSYMMGMFMSYVKDISRFEHASRLCTYAGISSISGTAITKAKIPEIKDKYSKMGKDFKGFNTQFSGRLYVLGESMLKSRGWFYEYYIQTKERLTKRAINNKEVEKREGDNVLIMKGKKNQPLKAWAHANAMRRMLRIFLHIFWKEWRELNGLSVRDPYATEYLGHSTVITLDEILKAGG